MRWLEGLDDTILPYIEVLEEALGWLQEFGAKMSDQHPGFVHVERKARRALGPVAPIPFPPGNPLRLRDLDAQAPE